MEEKKKNNLVKIIIGIIVVVLIIGVVVFANNRIKQEKAEKEVEKARQELNEALDNLHNLKPGTQNTGISNTTPTSNEIQDYINNYFVLENAVVEQFSSYSGKKWGLTKIQVKNKGEKTVKEFEITVYFQDENGNDIAEDSFYISDVTIGNLIKPNYSWKQDEDRYYTFDNLTSEVNPSRHTIKITDIEFE